MWWNTIRKQKGEISRLKKEVWDTMEMYLIQQQQLMRCQSECKILKDHIKQHEKLTRYPHICNKNYPVHFDGLGSTIDASSKCGNTVLRIKHIY